MTERFISPCKPPTPRQREILVILIEECAEVQHRATKALRFGMGEIQPGQPDTNSARLSGEIGDLSAILDMGVREGVISARLIAYQRVLKERKLAKYMQTEPPSSDSKATEIEAEVAAEQGFYGSVSEPDDSAMKPFVSRPKPPNP